VRRGAGGGGGWRGLERLLLPHTARMHNTLAHSLTGWTKGQYVKHQELPMTLLRVWGG
jgi:hypothetical protein